MKVQNGKHIIEFREELPPTAMSFGGTAWNRTGSWKYLEPYYQDLTPPCAARCLTGIDIVQVMRAVDRDDWEGAAREVLRVNPFPAITGRVCPRPCEQPCNRKAYGGAISIRAVERRIGDWKIAQGLRPNLPAATGPTVHIVGSGPAGLSAAYTLTLLGHPVVVHETAAEAGGLLRFGIPGYRLPADVVKAEVRWLAGLGVRFETGKKLGAADIERLGPTIIAVGYSRSRKLGAPGEESPGVHDGVQILAAIRMGLKVDLGRDIAVIGGGNTAVDVARSLLRLGAKPAIYYRRSAKEMPAFKEEIEQAEEEGLPIRFLVAPTRVEALPSGKVRLHLVENELGKPDASGRAQPVPKPGSDFSVDLDAVVKALGEQLDQSLLPPGVVAKDGVVATGDLWETGRADVFAAGDCAGRFGNTVSEAIKSGRLAAHALSQHLAGKGIPPAAPMTERGVEGTIAKFKNMNMAYFRREAARTGSVAEVLVRSRSFDPIEGPLTPEEARAEATRCFKCGTCTECDNCFVYCPDLAVIRRPEGRYVIDVTHCKGCGVCVEECPREAIHMHRATT